MLNKPGALVSLGVLPLSSFAGWIFLLTTVLAGALWAAEHRQRRREAAEARRLREALGHDLVSVIRNQRHGFMNHLQVISGWLQLKKPDHVLEYIEGIRRKREQESQILRIKSLEVLGLLLAKSSLAEANELDVLWEVDGPLADPPPLWTEALGTVLEVLIAALARAEEPRHLVVHLVQDGSLYRAELTAGSRQFTSSSGAELAGLTDLAARVRAAGGQWTEELAPLYSLKLGMSAGA